MCDNIFLRWEIISVSTGRMLNVQIYKYDNGQCGGCLEMGERLHNSVVTFGSPDNQLVWKQVS